MAGEANRLWFHVSTTSTYKSLPQPQFPLCKVGMGIQILRGRWNSRSYPGFSTPWDTHPSYIPWKYHLSLEDTGSHVPKNVGGLSELRITQIKAGEKTGALVS